MSLLQKIAQKENFILPKAFADKIVEASESNLRRAILMLEASKIQQCPFKDDQTVKIPDWEMFIADICREVMEEQSPKRLLEVRDKFYLLLTNCIPAELIIKVCCALLLITLCRNWQLCLLKKFNWTCNTIFSIGLHITNIASKQEAEPFSILKRL